MASSMPTIPRFFFLYVEPSLCLFGAFNPIFNPTAVTTLLPLHLGGRVEFHENPTPLETLLSLNVATLMFMISMVTVAVMVYGNKQTIKAYTAASALTDFPHWGALFYVLGSEGLSKWRFWSPAIWMQMLVPLFTFSIKVGYLIGAFGPDKDAVRKVRKKA